VRRFPFIKVSDHEFDPCRKSDSGHALMREFCASCFLI
jgi:hypothetical protein